MEIKIPAHVASRLTGGSETVKILNDFYTMRSGSIYRVAWNRQLAVLKRFAGFEIVKAVSALVRAGIDYNKINDVQEKRESGELPEIPQPLLWGEWLDFPRVIYHKDNLYLRFYPFGTSENMEVCFSIKTPSGQTNVCDRETAKGFCRASEFPERESLDCFAIKLANIQYLRVENVS